MRRLMARHDPAVYSGEYITCVHDHTKALCEKARHRRSEGLPDHGGKLTPHVLRHYCASQLYQSGMSLFVIQELLEHSWTGTTARYVNPRELHLMGEKPQVA